MTTWRRLPTFFVRNPLLMGCRFLRSARLFRAGSVLTSFLGRSMVDVNGTTFRCLLYGRLPLLAVSLFTATTILATTATGAAAAVVPPSSAETTPAPPTETTPPPPTETTPAPPTETILTVPPPPVVKIAAGPKTKAPRSPTTITITVPPLRPSKPKGIATTPTEVQPTPTPSNTQPAWRQPIEPRYAPVPALAARAAKSAKKKASPQTPAKPRASRPAPGTPLRSILENPFATLPWISSSFQAVASRGTSAAAAPPPAQSDEHEGVRLSSELLIGLGLGGIFLLCIAGATPALAHHWPRAFAPLARRRAGASSLGLSVLVTALVSWVIAGSGA